MLQYGTFPAAVPGVQPTHHRLKYCHFVFVIMSLLLLSLSCSYQVTLAVLDDLLAVFFRQFRLPSQQLDNLALSWKIQKSKSEQTLVHFPHLLLITEKVEIMLQVESAQVLSDEVFIQLHWWACRDLLQFRLCSIDDGRDHLDCVRGVAEPAVSSGHCTRDTWHVTCTATWPPGARAQAGWGPRDTPHTASSK